MDLRNTSCLENICGYYKFVLVDNCGFQELLNVSGKGNSKFLKEKIEYYTLTKKAIEFWRGKLGEHKNIYTTLKVLEEIRSGSFYKYNVKKNFNPRGTRSVLDLKRAIRDKKIERNRLILYLENSSHILKFNKKEQKTYDEFYERYLLIAKYYGLINSVKDVDYDLLISGVVLSKLKRNTALVSNDINGIVPAWKEISKREHLSPYNFGFFIVPDLSVFEKVRK